MTVRAIDQRAESLTRQLGMEMFERIRGDAPTPFRVQWWEEHALRQLMRDERLKVQAFRFIDVLPTMHDRRDIARHLREYFAAPAPAPNGERTGGFGRRREQQAALAELEPRNGQGLARWVARAMSFERADSLRARVLAWLAWQSATKMSHRFIAGSNTAEAVRTLRKLHDQRLAFTIDVLGEAAVSDRESGHYQKIYLDLISELPGHAARWPAVPLIDEADGQPIPRVNVSVKLSALYSQFDAIDPAGTSRCVLERLRPLLRKGMELGAHVHIDMEHYAFKDLTLHICREVFMEDEFRDYPHFGVVLQAYLKECERDADQLIDWCRRRGTPIWVRLVKGAYWDTETVLHDQQRWPWPVWEQKWQSDACYERVTRLLLENNQHVYTAFGSHNVRSLCHALALRRLLEVPERGFEFQMLYGMGDAIKRAAVDMGQRVRIYAPFGELLPGMAYLIRRLLENTANESFLRNSVDENLPAAELLRDPHDLGRYAPPPPERLTLKHEFGELIMDPFDNVPNADFTHAEPRRRMAAAIDALRARLGREYPLVIGGQRVATGRWDDSVNPGRPAQVVGRIAQADLAAAERAVQAAAEAARAWRRVAPAERAEYLFKVARLMQQRRFELAALQTIECGKPWREADADVSEAIDFCNYYGKEMVRMADNVRRRDIPGETNEYYYAPRGVVGVIAPWNFPLAILTGMTTAALVTGNTVIMKPAQPAAVIGAGLMELFEEAHLPPGVLNYLPGPGEVVGETLVKHPQVAMIAFTGSRGVGCRINRVAAETITSAPSLKKVMAEMGGKNATIVDSDADLDEAVKGVVYAAFGYAGQKCSASSRCIVLDAVYERFAERLVEASRSISVGPAEDPGTFVPPVVDKRAYEGIRKYVEIGKAEAHCALEVDVSTLVAESSGYYVGPTIFTDVDPKARIAQEEIFGPVLALIRARDIDHAIEIFNGTDFALTGGIFSRSPAHIEKARHECECGNFYINRRISGALVDLQPFGGFRMSGIGSKAGGPDYLVQFCEPRTVTENTLRRGFAPSAEVAETVH